MLKFRDQVVTRPAFELPAGRAGELTTYAEAHILGDFRRGPVPVRVKYGYHFRYDRERVDNAGFEVNARMREFETPEERDASVATLFRPA